MGSSAPAPESGTAPVPQRHISGMLLLSLFLSIGGLLVVPVVGGIGGLVFSILGRRRVRNDPLLIGPRFALICIAMAAVSLPLQVWRLYDFLPKYGYFGSLGDIRTGFFAHLENRQWQGVYDAMHVDYRDTHSVSDVEAVLAAVFPGADEIKLTEENLKFHQMEGEEERKKESERFLKFLDGEGKIFDFELDCSVLFPKEREQVDMGLRVRVHREGYMTFKSRVLDFDAERVPLKETDAVTSGKPGDGSTEEPGDQPDENPGEGND